MSPPGRAEASLREPPGRAASAAYANYVLGVLFACYVFNWVDRNVLAILLGPMKAELGFSLRYPDWRAGLAQLLRG